MSTTRTAIGCVIMLALVASAARADVPDEAFAEQSVCTNERGSANVAADQVAHPNDAWAVANVEQARRDLAAAKRGRDRYQRALDEAVAQLEAVRARVRADIAKRDTTAKVLADCLERERAALDARNAARRADRQRKAEEEAARRERLAKLMGSKPVVQLALSALICIANNDRADAIRAISDEKKYARIGGVQDNAKIYRLQQAVRDADQREARLGRELKTRNARAISCGDPKARQVIGCIVAPVEDVPCLIDEIAGPVLVAHELE